MSELRMLSLCSGYEGLGLAVQAVTGARLVAVSDIDKGANKILTHRFPDIPNLGDLKTIDWAAWAGTEVMTAGYPCQPFSHAGKREGTDDPRHIFPFIADGIRIVGPRLVVLENVRGHLALGFDTVLGTLADIGYDARWVCVRASDVGAPHRRERLFIVATPRDSSEDDLGHGSFQGGRGSWGTQQSTGSTDRNDANADGEGLQERRHQGELRPAISQPRAAAHGGGGASSSDADGLGHERAGRARGWREGSADHSDPAADASGERHGRREDGRGLGRLDRPDEGGARERERTREVAGDRGAEAAADAVRSGWREGDTRGRGVVWQGRIQARRDEGAGASRPDRPAVETDWGQYAPAINRWAAVLGRPAPAPTEPGAKGQPRLSPRFVEFMMGLPEGWVTDVPDLTRNEQLKALGNGVVWQQAAAALTFLLIAQERAA